MKKITKGILIAVVTGAIFVGGAITGGLTGASNNSWTTEVIQQATGVLNKAGQDKKTELLSDSTNISDAMKNALQPKITAEEKELERLLEEYYRMKLEGLTDTQEFYNLEAQITHIKNQNLNRYKKEIDEFFVNLQ